MANTAKDGIKAQAGRLNKYLPILRWLPRYDRSWLRSDVIAGLTLWGLVVPEAMAYAGIANLPPQAGLYTLLASLLVYAIFGSSRHLVVQATSSSAALLASVVMAALVAMEFIEIGTTPNSVTYQAYASAFVLVVGIVFLVAGIARLGFITQFLSKPVMDGFITGLAVFVVVGQLNNLFGLEKTEGNTIQKLAGIVLELPEANWITFAFGAAALAFLFLLPRRSKKIPSGLLVLFGSIGLSEALALNAKYGVAVVGTLPQGLPTLSLPFVPLDAILWMILPAIGVLLVVYSESLGVAREFAEKHGYEVAPNQELDAHALANIASSLFGGMIAAGSMSASAVKEEAGARSQVTNLVSWIVTVVTVLFLTPIFESLPEAVLAALIIHAVWRIIASRKLRQIRFVSRTEFWLGAITLAGVILIDVLEGMIIGLTSALILVIYQSSRPHIASLGQVPGASGVYSDIARHPENIPVPGVLIVRIDAVMYYANALTIRDKIKMMIEEAETKPRALLIDLGAQDQIDLTSVEVLKGLVKELHGKNIDLYMADVHLPVRKFSQRTGLLELIGVDHIFPTVDAAVRYLEKGTN